MRVVVLGHAPDRIQRLTTLISAALPAASLDVGDIERLSAPEVLRLVADADAVFVHHEDGGHKRHLEGGPDSADLMRRLKTQNVRLPIIFVAPGGDEMLVARAFKAGATDYLPHSRLTREAVASAVRESVREQAGEVRAATTRALREAADDIVIKGYRIEYRLARSALSNVYLARDVRGDRVVALKVMQGFVSEQSGETLERFLREYESASSLDHRNVVRVHDFGFVDEQIYIAMEYLSGGTLRDRLVTHAFTPTESVEVLLQVAEALSAMNAVNILHRDLKPGNVMFRDDGGACVIDFGLAKHARLEQALTVPGRIYGTPYYMSPEQGQGLPVDIRSDLYSLGVLFFEMLTGSKPYAAGSALALVYKQTHAPVPRLQGDLIRWQPIIDGLMAKKPEQRPANPEVLRSLVYDCKTL
ncbi:MAG: protein kinase [Pseudomonadota bacterium]